MATIILAIQVSVQSGLQGAQRAVPGHRWLVRWNDDGSCTLLYLPTPLAAYELKSWRFVHQGEYVELARVHEWPIEQNTGWMLLEWACKGSGAWRAREGAAPSCVNAEPACSSSRQER